MIDQEEKIEQLKKRREKLDLTQKKLSDKAGVSQSFLAKTESGKMDPSYRKLKKVENALQKLSEEKTTAEELMNQPVETVQKNDKVENAEKIMKKNDFSQLPVMDGEKLVGSLRERDIMLADKENATSEIEVKKIMGPNFPNVDPGMPKDSIKNLLKKRDAVLVKDRSEVIGIVDRADFLRLD